ncbi:hypothetical protein TSMEX_002530 [Taenia solium]|eukprot:TsM_001037300 transcript=TsM_001037300 gene=TsM_001037300
MKNRWWDAAHGACLSVVAIITRRRIYREWMCSQVFVGIRLRIEAHLAYDYSPLLFAYIRSGQSGVSPHRGTNHLLLWSSFYWPRVVNVETAMSTIWLLRCGGERVELQ